MASAGGQDSAGDGPWQQRAPLGCLGHHWWLPGAAMFGAVPPCVRCCSGELQSKGTATVTLVPFEPCTFELRQQVCLDSDEAEVRVPHQPSTGEKVGEK